MTGSRPRKTPIAKTRLLCFAVGAVFGFALGSVFQLFSPSALPFPLFFPVVFASVFAVVVSVAAEQLFPVLAEVVLGFLVSP